MWNAFPSAHVCSHVLISRHSACRSCADVEPAALLSHDLRPRHAQILRVGRVHGLVALDDGRVGGLHRLLVDGVVGDEEVWAQLQSLAWPQICRQVLPLSQNVIYLKLITEKKLKHIYQFLFCGFYTYMLKIVYSNATL